MTDTGLYIHIPFCDGKCRYCNFFSRKCDDAVINDYVAHLIESIKLWGERLSGAAKRTFDTVYLGGGTPSLLGHQRLINILDNVKESFAVTDDAEFTVEVNPSSTDELDFVALRRSGYNRISIGLQSADKRELQLLGRRHSVDDARKTVQAAQSAGFDNLSLDVMLAIPEQTIDSLRHTLAFCADCGAQHISAYILKIEPGTPFYHDKENLSLYDDDVQATFYEETVRYLQKLGYHQYEISNFCLDGRESRHNLKYWHDEEYLGLGPSAHSFLDGKRFFYNNSFEDFYNHRLTDEGDGGDEEEYMMLALRLTEGLIFSEFEKRFEKPVSSRVIQAARNLAEKGFVRLTDTSLSLTVKGFLVSNTVIAYLLQNT